MEAASVPSGNAARFWVASTKSESALDRSQGRGSLGKGEGGLWRRVIADQKQASIAWRGTGPGAPAPDFGPLAKSYDRLRPADSNWWQLFELLADEGDFTGRRVLDVGCGTGRLALALAERGARVWGVDPSEDMLRQARALAGANIGLKRGRAEALPFKDAWFERAVLRTVVHLIDRGLAFPELVRVLAPGGRALIATFAPEHFASDWLIPFFPQVAEIDRARFPTRTSLETELAAAGFVRVRGRTLHQRATLAREDALERIRERFISTLRLLDDEAFEQGLALAERELPDSIERTNHWVVLVAERSATA